LPHYRKKLALANVTAVFVNVVFSNEDEILIKHLYQLKGYKVTELINEFPNKWMIKSNVNRLLKKLKDTGSGTVKRLIGSGRP